MCRERKDPKSNTVVHSSIQYRFIVESGLMYSFISIRAEKCVLSCIVLSVSNTSIHCRSRAPIYRHQNSLYSMSSNHMLSTEHREIAYIYARSYCSREVRFHCLINRVSYSARIGCNCNSYYCSIDGCDGRSCIIFIS